VTLAEWVPGPVVACPWNDVQAPVVTGGGVAIESELEKEPHPASEYCPKSTWMKAIPPDVVRYQPFTR
jgi:hypothetical protein